MPQRMHDEVRWQLEQFTNLEVRWSATLRVWGDPSPERCIEVFREPCDGIIVSAETASASKIKEDQQYEGIRIKFLAHIQTNDTH
jgi:hypothetical protein